MELLLTPYPRKTVIGSGTNRNRLFVPSSCPHANTLFPTRGDSEIRFEFKALAPHEYILEISADSVTVYGCDERAQFYGLVTLRQLVNQFGNRLPAITVEDRPVHLHRAVQLCLRAGFRRISARMDRTLRKAYGNAQSHPHISLYGNGLSVPLSAPLQEKRSNNRRRRAHARCVC